MPFDIQALKRAAKKQRIVLRLHAVKRMFSRKISNDELVQALDTSVVIEDYPKSRPYPSALLLGWTKGNRRIHLVCALGNRGRGIVITVYEPDEAHWKRDWKTRRKGK